MPDQAPEKVDREETVTVHPFKLTSLLLQHPDPDLVATLSAFDPAGIAPASAAQRTALTTFLEWYRTHSVDELQRSYVDNFDFDRQRSLHLTYHLHGDSRQRGLGLLQIKTAYRKEGLDPGEGELPDYLPVMLEFAALAPGSAGADLLDRHRASIELIRDSLKQAGSPWAELIDVIRDGLPGLSRRQLTKIRRLAAEGPPTEEVGMEPFAPPEVMPNQPGDVPLPLIGGRK